MFRCLVIVVHCTHSLVPFLYARFPFESTTFPRHSRILPKGMDVDVFSVVGDKIVIVFYFLHFNSRLLLATARYFHIELGLKMFQH